MKLKTFEEPWYKNGLAERKNSHSRHARLFLHAPAGAPVLFLARKFSLAPPGLGPVKISEIPFFTDSEKVAVAWGHMTHDTISWGFKAAHEQRKFNFINRDYTQKSKTVLGGILLKGLFPSTAFTSQRKKKLRHFTRGGPPGAYGGLDGATR